MHFQQNVPTKFDINCSQLTYGTQYLDIPILHLCITAKVRKTLLAHFNAFSEIEFCVGLLYRTQVVFDSKTADPCVCNLELSQDVLWHIVLGHRVDNVVLIARWPLARPVLVTLLLHTRWHIKRSSTWCDFAATNHQNFLQQRSHLPPHRTRLVSTCPPLADTTRGRRGLYPL